MAGVESIANFFLVNIWTIVIGASVISVFVLMKKLGILYRLRHKVDAESTRNGGELVAEVLKAHGVKFLFTLVGGHISPILVAAEKLGIQVVDTRHEATAVFAADAVARMSGVVGVAAVTAGPGLTNTVTAVKNAQMAESPLLLIGGAAATLLKGRGALQDIDQMCLFKPLCKFTATITCLRDIAPTLRKALHAAQSGTPGPVFVECPIDVLYPIQVIRKEIGMKTNAKGISQRIVNMYLAYHLNNLFVGAWEKRDQSPLPVTLPYAKMSEVRHCMAILSNAERPVIILGSQATLPPTPMKDLRKALEDLGIPCFLGGMTRGLLGKDSPIQMRQKRKEALQDADVVILAGAVCDFRLGYGRSLSYRSKIVAINRNKEQLYKNSDMFWMPTLAVQADAANFITRLAREMKGHLSIDSTWLRKLKARDEEKEATNLKLAEQETDMHVNPMKVLYKLEEVMGDNAILVADGGDFVGTAAYILRPRGPLMWLDPGAFGTLGVGGGFALGAKLVRPESEVWIIYGDGSLGYSVAEFDTFTRFKTPVIALVGNDACWSQIAREQVPMLGSNVACQLAFCDYHVVAEGYGGKGYRLDRSNEAAMEDVLRQAQKDAHDGHSVLLNCFIGKTSFREGSISV